MGQKKLGEIKAEWTANPDRRWLDIDFPTSNDRTGNDGGYKEGKLGVEVHFCPGRERVPSCKLLLRVNGYGKKGLSKGVKQRPRKEWRETETLESQFCDASKTSLWALFSLLPPF